jgi:predicted nucleic-acid-binding protein
MIGLDTNVLVRYFTQDDDRQAAAAERAIESLTEDDPGYIPVVVLVELVWVLGRAYRLPNDEVLEVVQGMLGAREFRLQQAEVVARATRASRTQSVDFADALIGGLARAAGCETTLTFDQAASQLDSMTLIET